MRTLVDIPEEDLRALTEIGRAEGRSRAALIRRAVAEWLAGRRGGDGDGAFGLWSAGEDGLAYQRRLRAEW